jgi:ABC-type transport system involved in multi-copper enzyme maturation permease subunit
MLIALGVLFAVSGLLRAAVPKVAAIASTTAKEAFSQPLFYVLLAIGAAALILFPFIPYNTFGEDLKMVKDSGLTLIMVLSIVMALWTSSVSVADEIEGRIALTVLSKPISRREFLLGKFLGIAGPVAVMFIILGALFLASVSYKVVFEARESALPDPTWHDCAKEILQIMPGLLLAFMEAVVLTSISVAISTRLPMLANLVICGSIYFLGHLVPLLANSAVGKIPQVGFVAGLLSAVLPVLENFNVTAIAFFEPKQAVPLSYLGLAGAYCLLYCGVAMLLALLLFEDRDLA